MSGGGGGGTTTSTGTTYQSSLPEYAEPYYQELADRASTESKNPYYAYGGQRVAGFQPETYQSFGLAQTVAGRETPWRNQGAAAATDVAGSETQRWDTYDNKEGYYNPFMDQVLNVEQDRATRRFQEQGVTRNAEAVQAGAFGGSRQIVADSLAQRDLNEQLARSEAEGLRDAYFNAQQTFAADEDRTLQGRGLSLSAAQLLNDLEGSRYENEFQRVELLSQIGAQKQQQQQAGLDVAYQNYINQRDYPRQQLAFYSQILHGMPVTPQQEVMQTSTQPRPNPYSQIGGAGLTAAGLYGALK